ncbi:type II toxin-antitoxin system Phd/YefM family antitoxin [Tsukamurella spumae]|uniref:Type II toxin-antitoxin system prevent-host-death family antitoxin n=1 Tax=Tsukamurella spumae TaxID=44753 RepID=A0A846X1K0_9ACTN|nr:type II toxin-antitoxin system prevent-host-death family antitoxin [Tsukamurella spumae]NKY19154.1 type II toxin-antitoxin system prevent-host-death family antitoxin [Tsukamurella spumae]
MGRVIAQRELRNDNAAVMKSVEAGETFVVTRNGTPVAELRPVGAGRRMFVRRADLRNALGAGVRIDAEAFRADVDSLAEQEPW